MGRRGEQITLIPVRTRRILPPKDDFSDVLDHLPRLRERDIVFITSKILAIHQGRCVKIGSADKKRLIKREAEAFVPSRHRYGDFLLTIKDSTLIPSAGIDESNGNGYYILWPRHTQKLLKEIRDRLIKKNRIRKLGVVATDSHTTPLRWGVMGISIGSVGIEPLADYRGKKDIFGRRLKYTQANVVDTLSAIAVLLMGESGERTPIAILRSAPNVQFTNKDTRKNLLIPPKKDIYSPLLGQFRAKHSKID